MSPAAVYSFGPFELDEAAHQLTRDGTTIPLGDRQMTLLLHLVANPGVVISKNDLIDAAWGGVAVTDNSVEQAISILRRLLAANSEPYVETVPRRGYRFSGRVTRVIRRQTDDALDALLAPHRAWIEGRAALETLDRERIAGARRAFETALEQFPGQASAHVGLANACVMQFETTRASAAPDVDALAKAAEHAREACRLDAQYGEAWATLGLALDRSGRRVDALAASRHAVMLEPDNWRHQLRLASVGWGEERLRAARRTLALLPGFPLAHWLAATVLVARQALDEARRELQAGTSAEAGTSPGDVQFTAVGLHWTLGLIHLAQSRADDAVEEFHRELALDLSGHLYARECSANAWYALGVHHARLGHTADATACLEQAIERVPLHPMANLALVAVRAARTAGRSVPAAPEATEPSINTAILKAAELVLAGNHEQAADLLHRALAAAPPGQSGWLLPIEPLLGVAAHPASWSALLARLRARAS